MNESLKAIIAKRIALDLQDDFGRDKCWEEELKIVEEDPETALLFINQDGTDEEVYFLSEILCDIYDSTLDDRFIEAFRQRADKIDNNEMKRSILQEIEHV